MKRLGHGCIITMSSAAARRPTAHTPVALRRREGGHRAAHPGRRLQAGPDGVRANCLAPETIMTERNERAIPLRHP